MLSASCASTWAILPFPLAAGVLAPMAILALCIVAGIGTVLMLPGRREPAIRSIGGAVLLLCLLVFLALLVRTAANTAGDVYFWLFSFIAIIAAIRMVTHPRPVYSALYFVLTVVASAGLFVLLWAEFMAAALVLIYAGAILVTYVFVIMLAQQVGTAGAATAMGEAEYDRTSRQPVLAAAVGFAMMGVIVFLIFDKADGIAPASAAAAAPQTAPAAAPESAIRELAAYLFTKQSVALELAGVILMLAMVGAVIIARRPADVYPQEPGIGPLPPIDDNPHSITVSGTRNPAAKAYPEA
jgi:NADH-quinone oxidoreductase subunit J